MQDALSWAGHYIISRFTVRTCTCLVTVSSRWQHGVLIGQFQTQGRTVAVLSPDTPITTEHLTARTALLTDHPVTTLQVGRTLRHEGVPSPWTVY